MLYIVDIPWVDEETSSLHGSTLVARSRLVSLVLHWSEMVGDVVGDVVHR